MWGSFHLGTIWIPFGGRAPASIGSPEVAITERWPGSVPARYTCSMGTVDINRLSSEERLRLLEELWESLSATPEAIPLTDAQREELDRRLDELDRDGPTGIPWEEVLHGIRGRTL